MRILISVGLNSLAGLIGVHDSQISKLVCLSGDDVLHLVDSAVNSLAVLDVNERTEVENTGSHQSQAPEGNNLDEKVGDNGRSEDLIMSGV